MERFNELKFSALGWSVSALVLVYVAVLVILHPLTPVQRTLTTAGQVQSGRGAKLAHGHTTGTPSNRALSEIANAVGKVKGVNELVVSSTESGNGYAVSVSIAVDYSGGPSNEIQMRQLAGEFFRAVYAAPPPVQSAQLYFMNGNQIVGGAGLGRDVFEHLSLGATTGQGRWVTQLQTEPQVTGKGPLDRWFAVSGSPN